MNFKPKTMIPLRVTSLYSPLPIVKPTMAQTRTRTLHSDPSQDSDELLCSDSNNHHNQQEQPEHEEPSSLPETASSSLASPRGYLSGEARAERAWAHWTKLGRPKLIVAPMVDNSELPFRMLCRRYGAEAAYTPMLHSRIFTESEKYRNEEFTTCKVRSPFFFFPIILIS